MVDGAYKILTSKKMDEGAVVLNSLHSAVIHYKNDNYGRAFAHFLVVFELESGFRRLYRDEFVYTLREWGLELERKKRLTDLSKCYLDGLRYFPNDLDIIKNYSVHLIKIDTADNGNRYSQFVSAMCEKGLLYEKLIQSSNLDLVSRWHFRMVNDYERNMAYYKALLSFNSEKQVKALDIGAGSGLLSLFASNSPSISEIYAIEAEEVLAEVAKNVFRDNYSKNVNVISKHSTMLSADDINGRADLVVTEIFDAALFGEHSLVTILHAWDELLSNNAKIIPRAADLFITGIQCERISRKYRLLQKIDLLKDTVIISNNEEPYDADNLKTIEWTRATETIKILSVDFSSCNQLKTLLDGQQIPINLKCTSNGIIDAFAIWFDLHLDESITITTNPNIDNVKCWEQAIFPAGYPQSYQKGEEINLNFSCVENCVTLERVDTRIIPKHFPVSAEVISYLNDTSIISITESLAQKYYGSALTVLDYSPFPLFGLLLTKNGGKFVYIYKDGHHSSLVDNIVDLNNIPQDKIGVLHNTADELPEECLNYDIVLLDIITTNGTLDPEMYILLRNRHFASPRKQTFPYAVKLICEVIESDYLPYCSRANDDNSFAFKIAKHLNTFSIQEQWIVDKNLLHRKLTSRLEVDILREDSEPLMSEHLLPVIQKGKTDAVLYWFELCYGENLKISTFDSTHYNIACFLLHKNDIVYENNYVKLAVKQHSGLLKIYFNC